MQIVILKKKLAKKMWNKISGKKMNEYIHLFP